MRSMSLALTLAGALLATAATPERPLMSAGDLEQLCTGSDHVSVNVCRVYILGVAQGIAVGLNIADGKTRSGRPCTPAAISGETLELTVKKRLAEDLARVPALAGQDASGFIASVLADAFPCRQAQR
jgi:hypothetical protein